MLKRLVYLTHTIETHVAESRLARKRERGMRRSIRRTLEFLATVPDDQTHDRVSEQIALSVLSAEGMDAHRRIHLRRETRSALLCKAFMRGVPYMKVEHIAYSYPDLGTLDHVRLGKDEQKREGRIMEMIKHYTDQDKWPEVLQRFTQWRDDAYAYCRMQFQDRDKLIKARGPKPRFRRRRLIDDLIRLESQKRMMPMREVLLKAGISVDEWTKISRGEIAFTHDHAAALSGALEISPQLFMLLEDTHQRTHSPQVS